MSTIIDVARTAGVSPKTVSRVINQEVSVSEVIRQKVLKTISELNYSPNEAARRLRSTQTNKNNKTQTFNIGCIMPDNKFSHPYFSRILEGIDYEILKQKYHLFFIYSVDQIASDTNLFIEMINSEKVDGIILLSVNSASETSRRIYENIRKRIKVLVLSDSSWTKDIDCIDVDKFQAGFEAVKYLAGLGHKRIGFVGDYLRRDDERFNGFKSGLQSFGLKYDENIIEGELLGYAPEDGYRYMQKIIERAKPLPTAVFAVSDKVAIGAMKAIQSNGLKIPDDISVVGFDNIENSENTNPPLTTFNVKKEELGSLTVKRLMERIENPDLKPITIKISADLIIRNSCRSIKQEE